MQSWPAKDPDEELDYQVDWTLRLAAGETIATSTFILAEGDVVLGDTNITGAFTTVWISGGTAGGVNTITNRITTSASRTYDKSAKLRIRSK
jgi:hypothetical protein